MSEGDKVKLDHFASHYCADYVQMPFDEALNSYQHYTHACHAMLYALPQQKADQVKGKLQRQCTPFVLMHMRFDGFLGFPGGLCDPGETPGEGINRELNEEIGLDLSVHSFSHQDHLITHRNDQTKLCLHFYAKKLPWKELVQLEQDLHTAPDYGAEVLGPIRVPLQQHSPGGATNLGTFLAHRFIGNTRDQLLFALKHFQIVDTDYLNSAVTAFKTIEQDVVVAPIKLG